MLGRRSTPAPRAALLARDHARSDDLETDDGPDPMPPPAEPPIHPFTGTFADAEHTVAYRSKAFRMMMLLAVCCFIASAGAEGPREPLTSAREGTLEVFSLR